jgi:hypothetical protein
MPTPKSTPPRRPLPSTRPLVPDDKKGLGAGAASESPFSSAGVAPLVSQPATPAPAPSTGASSPSSD